MIYREIELNCNNTCDNYRPDYAKQATLSMLCRKAGQSCEHIKAISKS
jgi:hypothetical protein